ncbi:MAG: hypothetical protein Q9225_004714, partial [Loekoesia sp. 1 TL-2023]
MASHLCPRPSAPFFPLVNHLKQPARPLLRCLHHAEPPALHQRLLPISETLRPQTTAPHRRTFTTSPSHFYKTVQEARS